MIAAATLTLVAAGVWAARTQRGCAVFLAVALLFWVGVAALVWEFAR